MKTIIAALTLTLSFTSFAGRGYLNGGRALTIPNSSIEAIISRDGVYSRLVDIQEGFERFKGLSVDHLNATFDLQSSIAHEIESVILNDGTELMISALRAGGDMGGG